MLIVQYKLLYTRVANFLRNVCQISSWSKFPSSNNSSMANEKPVRIALGGMHSEICTFSPRKTNYDDFIFWRNDSLKSRYPFLQQEASLLNINVEWCPLVRASAIPGGPVTKSAFDKIKDEYMQGLKELTRSGKVDGVYLDMHGSLFVEGMFDVEGEWMESVRNIVGKECLISTSYDLHGNVSKRVMENVDIFTAYRTAPHIDVLETYQRAVRLLLHCLKNEIKPCKAFVPVPILLPGEQTATEWEPGLSLYKCINEVEKEPSILDASIMIGYVWADEPRSTACTIAIGKDQKATEAAAIKLASKFWDVRHKFQFGSPAYQVDECIERAIKDPEMSVIISDSGDNPTAGGVGDVPFVLGRLIALGAKNSLYASIPDKDAVLKCFAAGQDATVDLSVGGKLDPVHGKPLAITGRVIRLATIPTRQGGENKHAIVEVDGVQVIITEMRTPFHYKKQFEELSLDPKSFKIIVVKIGYLVPELKEIASKNYLAFSPGAVNQYIEDLSFQYIQRPMFPLDKDFHWEPQVVVPQ